MEWFSNNAEWVIGSIITLFLGIGGWIMQSKKKSKAVSQSQSQTVNVYTGTPDSNSTSLITNQADIKSTLHILFIDDEKFKMVQILKSMGWSHIEYKKNVVNPDDEIVLGANVIFVDINGVGGKAYRNQGLGLAAAIKQKHPEKKVIIYSAETTGDRFDADLRKVDGSLPKNAEPIQFSNLIEDLCK